MPSVITHIATGSEGVADSAMDENNPLTTKTIVIVDDHELVGWSLASSLRGEGEQAHYTPAPSVQDVLETLGRFEPGLLVLDLDLGRDRHGQRIDGVDLIPRLRNEGWRVLVLSGSSNPTRIGESLAAGGFVWVSKNAPFPVLLGAIRETMAGRSVLPPARRQQLIDLYLNHEKERREVQEKLDRLTPREREVLGLLAAGKRAQAIAEHFVVSLPTVRTQVRAVLGKLEVSSQLEAVALYRRAG
jgi:DNA-binding NarL/FixJ family response regulator